MFHSSNPNSKIELKRTVEKTSVNTYSMFFKNCEMESSQEVQLTASLRVIFLEYFAQRQQN